MTAHFDRGPTAAPGRLSCAPRAPSVPVCLRSTLRCSLYSPRKSVVVPASPIVCAVSIYTREVFMKYTPPRTRSGSADRKCVLQRSSPTFARLRPAVGLVRQGVRSKALKL